MQSKNSVYMEVITMEFDWSEFDPKEVEVPMIGASHWGWGCPIEAALSHVGLSEAHLWVGWINYFIPMNIFAMMMTAWILAIIIYYPASIGLRWARAVS